MPKEKDSKEEIKISEVKEAVASVLSETKVATEEAAAPAEVAAPARAPHEKGKRPKQRRREKAPQQSEFMEKVVAVNRVAKVVAGGKNFSFTALVVVGDGKGKVGFAVGKAREVQDAIRKGLAHAKSGMKRIPMKDTTIPHEIIGRFGAAKVLMKPASKGTGVISGAAVRAICECSGIKDILTKSFGSDTPLNVIRATMQAMDAMLRDDNL